MNVKQRTMPEHIKPEVFVVDDEQIIALTLAAILNQSEFSATAFTNSVQARNSAMQRCPDYLITDVMMLKLNGVDLAMQIRGAYPQCKIVLFSGVARTAG